MQTKFCTLLVAALLISSISFGKIFRLGYSGPSLSGVDFIDPTAAVAAASTNDTIQLYPGYVGDLPLLSKKLVFIGDGYFLDKNNGLQVATTFATLDVVMDINASGSIFEGIQVGPYGFNGSYYGFTGSASLNGTLQNILFKRCTFTASFFNAFGINGQTDSIKNIIFSQCYFSLPNGYFYFYPTNNSGIKGIDFQNCIFGQATFLELYTNVGGTISNVSFENCSMDAIGEDHTGVSVACYFRNCIIRNEPSASNNDVFDYCIFETDNPPHNVTGTNNLYGKLFTTVFQGDLSLSTQWDSSYILKSGSPAIGYGRDFSNNPVDAGAFGSVNPYKLSGIPDLPAFYKLTAPGSAATTNPYTITFSVRANN